MRVSRGGARQERGVNRDMMSDPTAGRCRENSEFECAGIRDMLDGIGSPKYPYYQFCPACAFANSVIL